MFSFGHFPGVWGLKADVSEPSIGSIFLGRWRKNNSGWDVSVYLYSVGMWQGSGTASHCDSTRTALIYTTSPLHYLLCIHPPRPVTLFLLVLPLPRHIPSEYKYTDTSQPELFFLHLPRKMELIEGSETSAFKPQMPGKYPKENILHKEHGESLKSRYLNMHTVYL